MSPRTSTEPDSSAYGLSLSPQEVQRLMDNNSSEALIAVTDKIASAYSQQQLHDKDTPAAEHIFRMLLRETEIQVRQTLVQHVKTSTSIPKDIVLTLANDVAQVSLPILQYSQVLTDNDLLNLINNTADIDRYIAISKRTTVSEAISDTLLDKNNDAVTASLVDNEGAKISEKKLVSIIAEKPGNDALMHGISKRAQLPVAVVEKLIHVVSTSMGEALKKKYSLQGAVPEKEIAKEIIDSEVDKARESETLRLVRLSSSQEEIDRLVNQLLAFNRLAPSLILTSLCQGNFLFFETSLARLANIPIANARTLIKDRGDLGFRAIYNKSGLPESLFPAVRLLLKVTHKLDESGVKTGGPAYADRVIENLLQQSSAMPVDNLSYIVALVRRSAQ